MNKVLKTIALLGAVLALAGCETRTDKTDGGGVLLSISDFDVPIALASVTDALAPCDPPDDDPVCNGFVTFGEVTVSNIQKDPTQTASALQNVEITSYEVSYSRTDAGSRVPETYVQGLLVSVPVNGEFTLNDFPYMGLSQLTSDPLDELRRVGFDPETGSSTIPITFQFRFFGRTLSGDAVESQTAFWTVEFLP